MTGEQLEALAELREDVDDLRAALRWSLDSGQPEVGLRMGSSLARFWFLAAMQQEGADWLEELLAADPEVTNLEMGRAQVALAQTLNRIGRTKDAAAHARHAVELLEPLEEPQAFGWAQFYLGVTTTEPGYSNVADVETLYRASLRSFKEADYGPGIAMATLLLAGVALRRDPVESLETVRPLLAMAEKTNNTNLIAHCLEFVGYANRKLGNAGEVAPAYARAIRLHTEIGNWACLCHAFEGLGGYLVANQREPDAARIVGGTDTLRTHLSTVQSPYEQFTGDFYDWVDDLETRADLESARQEGRAWSRDVLVERALQYLDSQP
jgi:tetratricopeptide (TPR) repeat protein